MKHQLTKALFAATIPALLIAGAITEVFAPGQAKSDAATIIQAQSTVQSASLPALPVTNEVELEVVAALPVRPAAVVRTPNGRIIWTQHFGAPQPSQVQELLPDGTSRNFPAGQNYKSHSLRVDSKGVVWMLDMGGNGQLPMLRRWDSQTDKLVQEIEIPAPAYQPNSALQDFVIDEKNNQAIIADTAGGTVQWQFDPALVIVDLETGTSRRVLQQHPSVQAEPLDTLMDGKPLMLTINQEGLQIPSRWGVNGIAIDPAQEWVYYAPMTGTSIYRIRTADLADASLSRTVLNERVQRYGDKAIGDGILVDAAGNVYNTDLQYNAIGVTNAQGQYRLIRQDNTLLNFSEGFEPAADGYVYMATNQAHRSTFFQPQDTGVPPYYLLRFRPLASATR